MPGHFQRRQLATMARTILSGGSGRPPSSYPECVGWWPTSTSLGLVTVSDASAGPLGSWDTSNLTMDDGGGSGYSDPDGGTAAWGMTETTDGSPVGHSTTYVIDNKAGTYLDFEGYLKPTGRDWYLIFCTGTNVGRYFNASTGATAQYATDTVTTIEDLGDAGSGWRHFRAKFRTVGALNRIAIYPSASSSSYQYAGDGRVCGYFYITGSTYGVTQTRVQQIADRSGNGNHLTQAIAANQPLFMATLATCHGETVPMSEAGRAAYLEAAAVGAAASGDDPPFAIFGIWKSSVSGARVGSFNGSGSVSDVPLRRVSTNTRSYRHDGTTADDQTLSGYAADFDSYATFALLRNADRSVELWAAGAARGTATMSDLLSAAFTSYQAFSNNASYDGYLPDHAIIAGQIPGASAAERYAYLRPALQYMASPYGLAA